MPYMSGICVFRFLEDADEYLDLELGMEIYIRIFLAEL